jgi:hypothetical protein
MTDKTGRKGQYQLENRRSVAYGRVGPSGL